MNFLSNKKRSARMRPDACGICLLKQTASGAQSVTSPSKIEGFREFEADLSALFLERRVRENDEKETEKRRMESRNDKRRRCNAWGCPKREPEDP